MRLGYACNRYRCNRHSCTRHICDRHRDVCHPKGPSSPYLLRASRPLRLEQVRVDLADGTLDGMHDNNQAHALDDDDPDNDPTTRRATQGQMSAAIAVSQARATHTGGPPAPCLILASYEYLAALRQICLIRVPCGPASVEQAPCPWPASAFQLLSLLRPGAQEAMDVPVRKGRTMPYFFIYDICCAAAVTAVMLPDAFNTVHDWM